MTSLTQMLVDDEQVTKDDLASQLYRAMLNKIVTRVLPPGERLSTVAVAQAYGVSVTPVREAFKRLATEGLIEIRPRKESVVTTITADHIRHIYEIRTIIEAHAVTKGFRAATLDKMRACLDAMAQFQPTLLYDDFDLYWQYSSHDGLFHSLLVTETGNPRLQEIYTNLHAHALIAPVLFGLKSTDRGTEQRTEHEEIMHALSREEGGLAAQAVRKHLDSTRNVILDRWPAQAATPILSIDQP
ncbi:MAG: GntR family transcriptional regulator [Trueperaceae bacterium]